MKILHIADVHFGKNSLDDLREPCDRILELADGVDLVVIAGDLTVDRGVIDNASALACRTFVESLAELAHVLITPGNHDLSHHADQPNNVAAILSDRLGPTNENVQVIDTPRVVTHGEAALAVIPYPSAALFHANTGETSLESLNERLAQLSIGLAAEAVATGRVPLLVYHGTVEGGRHGDERSPAMLTRGTDVVLPTAALAGFQGVLAGHLHHPQTIQAPDGLVVYPGCVAPNTFGERGIEPTAVLWEVGAGGVSHERLLLPVTHQRIQVDVGADDWDASKDATLNLNSWIERAGDDIGAARVKVSVTASKQRLELLTNDAAEVARAKYNLKELRLERTTIPEHRGVLDESADRANRVNIPEALAIYAEQCEDPEFSRHLDEIQEVARDIEGLVEQQDSDPRYEFEPLQMRLENYKSIACAKVDFEKLPDRFGVFGPTGIGKSNLMLGLFWLLYGVNPKSEDGKAKTSLGEMVRRGEKKAGGFLRFRCRAGVFEITRVITRSAKTGQGTGKLFLTRKVAWVPVPLNEGNARQTQQAILGLVGPPELTWLTRHLRQHGESAVKMGASRLADSINSTLQLDFEARAELAKGRRDRAAHASDIAGAQAEKLQEQLPSDASIREAEKQHGYDLTRAKAAYEHGVGEVEAMDAEHVAKVERLARIDARAERAERLALRRRDVAKEKASCQHSWDRVRQELELLGDVPDLTELVAARDESFEKLQYSRARLHDLREQHSMLQLGESEALGGLRQSETAALSARDAAASALVVARRRLSDAAASAALLGEVPCDGARWASIEPGLGITDMSGCQLLSAAIDASEKLPELDQAIIDGEERLGNADADYLVATELCTKFLASAIEAEEGRSGELATLDASVVLNIAAHEAAVADLVDLSHAADKKAALRAERLECEPRLALARRHLDEIDGELMGAEGLVEEAAQLRDVVARSNAQRVESQLVLRGFAAQIATAEAGLEHVAGARKSRAQMLLQIEVLLNTQTAEDRQRMAASYYLQSVQRNGIPSLLLERLAPILELRVNEILIPCERQIRIETLRTTTTGVTRAEVNLLFQSPTSQGEWIPIAELSGGEEDIANAAWAVGLAQTAAEMSGTGLELIVLDEPFTGVSAEYAEAVRDVLGNIQRHVPRLCIITHKEDLKPMAGAVLQLSQNGDGVHMEVER